MAKPPALSSSAILAALRDGPFRTPAHAWLYEVRNTTGYSNKVRSADALVVSCWPSRGIWIAGIEVKVSRSDWQRELMEPAKAAEIMQWCNRWYIAAPPDVIRAGELPETWGLFEVAAKKASLVREAPQLTPVPMTASFIASVLRNAAEAQNAARAQGRQEGAEEAESRLGADAITALRAELEEARRSLRNSEQAHEWTKRDLAQVRHEIADFERHAGITAGIGTHRRGSMACVGRAFQAAEILASRRDLAENLRRAADLLAPVDEVMASTETRKVLGG